MIVQFKVEVALEVTARVNDKSIQLMTTKRERTTLGILLDNAGTE